MLTVEKGQNHAVIGMFWSLGYEEFTCRVLLTVYTVICGLAYMYRSLAKQFTLQIDIIKKQFKLILLSWSMDAVIPCSAWACNKQRSIIVWKIKCNAQGIV